MMKRRNTNSNLRNFANASLAWVAMLAINPHAFADESPVRAVTLHAAEHVAAATQTAILGAAHAGSRIVAVGNHGVVLLSDDDGKTYRQARSVPTDLTLTSTYFVDASKGWAVGHGGVVIATDDGGETWRVQRSDLRVDQPLFSVYFRDANDGWAVGLWSLALHTTDGGKSWATVTLPPPPGSKKADKNLYSIFPGKDGALFATSEQGLVLRSLNGGSDWTYVQTGYSGSLWTGVTLSDGAIVIGGLRGSLLVSNDNGATWMSSKSPLKSSITSLAQQSNGTVVAVGLDGAMLTSTDGGKDFSGNSRDDRAALTAVVSSKNGKTLLFSDNGPLAGMN